MTPSLGRTLAVSVPAIAFCLALYWPGIKCWFHQDDFAWLAQHMHIHSAHDILPALFSPKAQGTIRPWSERLFFLVFERLFGLDALPFRIWVFLTQAVNLALLASLTWRITGSAVAASVAGILWSANAALGIPMSWTSSYNQILCATFLLAAFRLFVEYTDTGDRRWWWAQFAVFLLGFGALEINVVFPGLAFGWVVLAAPRFWKSVLPMAGVSAGYAALHHWVSPKAKEGPYAMHFDASIFSTFGRYWVDAFGGPKLESVVVPGWLLTAGHYAPWILTAGLAGFVVSRLLRRQWLVLLPLAWYPIVLAPVLPLRDHVSDYYNTLPTIGLAILGAWAVATRPWAAVPLAALYLAVSLPVARTAAEYNLERSRTVRDLVLGVARARELHPGKIILLNGVTSDRYWAAVNDNPFPLLGLTDVFLAPGSEENIELHPELGDPLKFVLPGAVAREALAAGQVVVYDATGPRLRNITRLYPALAAGRLRERWARHIEAGHPAFAAQLGAGWYPLDGGYRWMGREAAVILGGPQTSGQVVQIKGICPRKQLDAGPLNVTVTLNGIGTSRQSVTNPDEEFQLTVPVPAVLTGVDKIELTLSVERTFTAEGESRPMGLAFGSFSIR